MIYNIVYNGYKKPHLLIDFKALHFTCEKKSKNIPMYQRHCEQS